MLNICDIKMPEYYLGKQAVVIKNTDQIYGRNRDKRQ